jgi:Putative auto-transporter adhesin, head GIN domain
MGLCACNNSVIFVLPTKINTKSKAIMKKQILATLVLVISVFATATAGGKKEDAKCSTSKTINVKPTFSKLVVDGNVDVVLYEDNTTSAIRTFGDNCDIAATSIVEKNGVLTIRNKNTKGEKVLVYVPVSHLSVIEAKGNSKVSTATPLESAQLTLVVKGDCKFSIQTAGNIDVVDDGESEVTIEKKSVAIRTASHA